MSEILEPRHLQVMAEDDVSVTACVTGIMVNTKKTATRLPWRLIEGLGVAMGWGFTR